MSSNKKDEHRAARLRQGVVPPGHDDYDTGYSSLDGIGLIEK